jgi:iron complex transport system ATP-binding protein
VVAAGPARAAVTTENVSATFDHPIDVQFYDGRWLARAARRTTLPSS